MARKYWPIIFVLKKEIVPVSFLILSIRKPPGYIIIIINNFFFFLLRNKIVKDPDDVHKLKYPPPSSLFSPVNEIQSVTQNGRRTDPSPAKKNLKNLSSQLRLRIQTTKIDPIFF